MKTADTDLRWMRQALRLARKGLGRTAPNPMVGAVLVRGGRLLGQGWHRKAGLPHAEIEALADAVRRGQSTRGATLYVTLEPCSTQGRTPPCTDALRAAGIRRVVVGAVDPNPRHAGRGFRILRRAGIKVSHGVLADACTRLNAAFNHWVLHGLPQVTVKAAMTLDGKIATARGESKWITGPAARRHAMGLRRQCDAIVVGLETVRADDPRLTVRSSGRSAASRPGPARLLRIVLDSRARTPLSARVVADASAALTRLVVTRAAPARRVAALRRRVEVWTAPARGGRVNLHWVLRRLAKEGVTSVLVEGGGEVQGAFLLGGLAQRVVFYYAPKVLGGRDSRRAVAGLGARRWSEVVRLKALRWRRVGADLCLTAEVQPSTR